LLEEMRRRPSLTEQLARGAHADEPYPLTALLVKSFRRSRRYAEMVDSKLRLGSSAMMQFGNLYTAALPAWLAAGLDDAFAQNLPLDKKPLLLVGYGSGDAAEAVPARVVAGWQTAAAKIGLGESLAGAIDLSQDQYRALHSGDAPSTLPMDARSGFEIERAGASSESSFQDFGIEYYRYTRPAA
jgi:hydroxymethylglutaryl-CoA synthase